MTTPVILFWLSCSMIVAALVMIVLSVRRRAMFAVLFNVITLLVNVCNAGFWWWMEGSCLLPHPSVIEYHPPMTLCPGQSTTLILNFQRQGKDL